MHYSNQPRTPSQAQIDANRRNAEKSTGPRTAAGKASSSRNRLLHGLRAQKHLVLDEDPDDFLDLLADLQDRFQPSGDGEDRIVMRIAAAQWRLDRTLNVEAGTYRERLQSVAVNDLHRQQELVNHKENYARSPRSVPPPPPPPDPQDRLARAFEFDVAHFHCLANLARYEAAIERSIDHSLRQLKAFQSARLAAVPNVPDQNDPKNQPDPPMEDPNPPAEPAETPATPSESVNCHSNPIDQGTARFSAATLFFALLTFLHTLPRYCARQVKPPVFHAASL
jgi:hypothetical protein